jgi:hypothetical protein
MKMNRLVLFVALSAIAAVPASAQTSADAGKKKDRLICRSETVIGSRLRGKRICRTKAEWVESEKQNTDAVREMQRTTRAPNNG